MNELKNSVSFRIRAWLIRRISGRHTFDKLTERVDKIFLHNMIEIMYEDAKKYTSMLLSQAVSGIETKQLAAMIEANKILNETQKSQIIHILQSQQKDASYLG